MKDTEPTSLEAAYGPGEVRVETSGMKKLLGRVEKRFGKGALMKMDSNVDADVRTFSAGSLGQTRAPENPLLVAAS